MLEKILPHLSAFNVSLAALAVIVLATTVRWIKADISIRRRGGYAPKIPSYVPLNIDLIFKFLKGAKTDAHLQVWDDFFMKHGNPNNPYTVEARPSGQRVVFTTDPENIKAILATQFNDYGKGPKFNENWHEFLGDSIFSTDHEKWHQSRQLIRPQFIKDRVSDLETFEKHVSILLPMLRGHGQEVDVRDLFFRYTLDAATDFLLGRSVESLEQGETAFATAFAEIQRIQNMLERLGALKFILPLKEFRGHLKTLNDFVEPYVDDTLRLSPAELEKRSKGEHGYTFLHALGAYTRDRKVLRDQLVAVLLAGRDTTACTLSWLFYELSKSPQLVAELRSEIEQQVGWSRPPTYEDLKNMKLLQHTMNETLRLYPVVPFNLRVALKDTSLPHGGGKDGNDPIGVLQGDVIGYSTHYMQLRQDIYPPTSASFRSPLVFDPHRWETWQPKPWTYIPFNGGPRLCVGQQFALTEMGYTVVRILQSFSRVECRVPERIGKSAVDAEAVTEKGSLANSYGVPGLRGVGRSSVKQMAESRDLKYHSEIVLVPAEKVNLAFWE